MFMEDDFQAAQAYLSLCCPKPEKKIYGLRDAGENQAQRDLDIIIPCYNEELYLRECLDSVVQFPFTHRVSVILVDDGSTDASPEIADEYAAFPNVIVIHQENKGFSGARNRGIAESSSKYLFFLDADDYILPERLDEMLTLALENNADEIEGILFNVLDGAVVNADRIPDRRDFREVAWTEISGYAGGVLVKSDFFRTICFPEGYLFEDCIMNLLIPPQCGRIYRYDSGIYAYRLNPDGVTAKSQDDIRSIHSYWILELMLETLQRLGREMDDLLYDRILAWIAMTYARTRRMEEQIRVAIFISVCHLTRDMNRCYTAQNKYRRLLQEALQKEDYGYYNESCEVVWKAMKSGIG